ncbi:MAG: hypothetical protein ACFCD0_19955 [Gemmataceae bacterium]
MSNTGVAEFDLIEELRLRRWARENYMPREERSPDLHPVILQEMEKKDLEGTEPMPAPTVAWTSTN